MAITSVDGTLAGMLPPVAFAKASTAPSAASAGIAFSFWATAGAPGASTGVSASTGTLLTSTSAQVAGQIYFSNPAGSQNNYIARLSAIASVPGMLILADRLMQAGNSSTGTINLSTTTAQTIGTPTLPARDANGNTAGIGVLAGLEITTALVSTNSGVTATLGYTNSTGTASRSGSGLVALSSIATPGQFYQFALQSGDIGIQQINTLTFSASLSGIGAVELVLYRPIAMLELSAANVPNAVDALTSGFPKMYNGSVPYLIFIPNSTSALAISGSFIQTQG